MLIGMLNDFSILVYKGQINGTVNPENIIFNGQVHDLPKFPRPSIVNIRIRGGYDYQWSMQFECFISDDGDIVKIDDKTNELICLQRDLKKVAIKIGPQHSWWDLIADIDLLVFSEGRKTRIGMDADQMIEMAKEYLKDKEETQ